MNNYVCSICGYIYEEAQGIPEVGILPGTLWSDLPDDWVCPLCNAPKSMFTKEKVPEQDTNLVEEGTYDALEISEDFSASALSALFSNLSKGCEKQYRSEEEQLFKILSDYYKSKSTVSDKRGFTSLADGLKSDLTSAFVRANQAADTDNDRGAKRALLWGEKVSRMQLSILDQYEKNGLELLENKQAYVCDICGFLYIGDSVPDVCPVCKVPSMKMTQILRR